MIAMVNCDQDEDKKEETDLRHVFVQFMAAEQIPSFLLCFLTDT